VLSGPFSPIGWSVGCVEVPLPGVMQALLAWRRGLGAELDVWALGWCWPQCLQQLDPLEAPSTSELLIGHGGGWTCYLNNDLNGGDPAPAIGYLARLLRTRALIAVHQPPTAVGHASTQFRQLGSDGDPPLMYRRTIAAHAEDGRWSWYDYGEPLPFEHPQRYAARLKRDRLDRALLVEYLGAMGIAVDDQASYGQAELADSVSAGQRVSKLSLRPGRVRSLNSSLPSPSSMPPGACHLAVAQPAA
jgi:hypothetical protein